MELNIDINGLTIDQRYEIRSQFNRELIESIADTEGIVNYNAEGHTAIYTPELVLVPGNAFNILSTSSDKVKMGMGESIVLNLEISQSKPNVFGEMDTGMVEYFVNGAFSLIKGRHIQKDDHGKILISETMAKNNNLNIGDYVYFEVNEFITRENGKLDNILESDKMEIIGIFKVNAEQAINFYTPEYDIAKNYIYMDMESYEPLAYAKTNGSGNGILKATFAVNNSEKIDEIIKDIKNREDIDIRNYKFGVDDSVYQSSANPLLMINKILGLIVGVIIISSLIFLIIILKFWLSNRSREIGVYMSMGVEKKGIASEFLAEAGIMILIACCLACIATVATSKPISNWIIQTATPKQKLPEEKSQKELEAETLEGKFDFAGEIIVPTQLPEEFNSMPTARDFVLILGIFMVVTVGALGTTFYLFFNTTPKDILNKMS
ncbi:ABC transporter permease [Anaerolentibacter hominis]|uniref:ABC transporter permease n=1 Tax=Anaerolentibacter hominis TaxID=3079009 RepID=UPI0031B894AA